MGELRGARRGEGTKRRSCQVRPRLLLPPPARGRGCAPPLRFLLLPLPTSAVCESHKFSSGRISPPGLFSWSAPAPSAAPRRVLSGVGGGDVVALSFCQRCNCSREGREAPGGSAVRDSPAVRAPPPLSAPRGGRWFEIPWRFEAPPRGSVVRDSPAVRASPGRRFFVSRWRGRGAARGHGGAGPAPVLLRDRDQPGAR